jgi:hypothetical protein
MAASSLTQPGPRPLAFDPSTGLLTIRGTPGESPVREGLTAGGFLQVNVGGQRHDSDPTSAWFDPALAGAGRDSLAGIRLAGGSAQAPLELGAQTLAGGLAVQAEGPVTVTGPVQAAGTVALTAPAITVGGSLRAAAVDLASIGLVNVAATGSVAADRVAVTARVFIDAGQVRADGLHGGQITVQAGNVLQGGRLSADGTAADGGTIRLGFTGSYIATVAARTSADGAAGGQVRIDGGGSGRLFSSGTQEAVGRSGAGGAVALGGGAVVLAGATADASGRAAGGRLAVGNGWAEAGRAGAARAMTVTGATLRADALGGGTGGRVTVGAATASPAVAAVGFHLIDPHPKRAGAFGFSVSPLSNGNLVVTDPHDDLAAPAGGAVYLFQGRSGALLGDLVGSESGDRLGDAGGGGPQASGPVGFVGDGVAALTNGNYVVRSPNWAGGRGAATWGDGTAGVTGALDASNSLVGSDTNDFVGGGFFGGGVTALSNGNYVVDSPQWNDSRGAATWGDGTRGVSGAVDPSNSLVGSHPGDLVGGVYGGSVTALSNGNYVVASPHWDSGRGAATWADGTVGITGPVSDQNSLVG